MHTKAEKFKILTSQAAFPAVCSFVIFCFFLSTISRLTDFFFKSSSQRRLIIFGFFIAAIFFYYFIWRLSKSRIFQRVHTFPDNILLFLAIALTIAIVTLFSGLIPMPKIPIYHTLEILALPMEDGSRNVILIQKIIETIDAPQKGSVDVDFNQLRIDEGNHERIPDGIRLEENAVLSYNSFYSGCISILFSTSPESKYVQVLFDKTVNRYSLFSQEKAPTMVDLCSPIPVDNLSLKWKIIVIGLYIADFISIFAIGSLILLLVNILLFMEGNKGNKIQHQLFIFLSIGIIAVSAIFQIRRIVFFPDEKITQGPPAKPPSVAGKLTIWDVYEVALVNQKLAYSFAFALMDVYPRLEQIYVDSKTWEVYHFDTKYFERLFGVYGLRSAEEMEGEPTRQKIDELIDLEYWMVKKIPVNDEGEFLWMKYQKEKPDSYVYITNRDDILYVIPDTLLDGMH